MFAEDYMIFCKATKSAARNLTTILKNCCNVSCQLVNFYKPLLQFSEGIEKKQKLGIVVILQVLTSNSIVSYLCCKSIGLRISREDFAFIKDKINRKMASWKARVLFQASKTIFIKSNLIVIPLFIMQGIRIHNYITRGIYCANRNFF